MKARNKSKGKGKAKASKAGKKATQMRSASARATTATTKKSPARKPAARPAKPYDPEAAQAAWMKSMTPGEPHRLLEPMVGTFTARTTLTMAPGQPPAEGNGVSENHWVLGGRYVEQVYRGTSMGMPFEGIGYTGYDNVQKKYVGVWMDNMGCGMMTCTSSGTPTPRLMTFRSVAFDPLTGKEIVFRSLVRVPDRDHHAYEMWTKGADGKEFRTLLVEYTRK